MSAFSDTAVIVAAYNEQERLPATITALSDTFPGAQLVVADDGSTDATAAVAKEAGVEVVSCERKVGKGGAMTAAARHVLASPGSGGDGRSQPNLVVLCDGDLGESAARLVPLVEAVRNGSCDLSVAVFAKRVGGGFGLAVGFAGWAVHRLCGLKLQAPISGQRALKREALGAVLPFAPRFGIEIGMTVDAARAGYRVAEIPLDLAHRATGRSFKGFVHRGRQLIDFWTVFLSRLLRRRRP